MKRKFKKIHTREEVFEISSCLISIYALRKARGEGGTPDPELEALLAHNAQKLKEKRRIAQLESRGADT